MVIELTSVETYIAKLFEQGLIKGPIHLSGGNEIELMDIFHQIDKKQDWVLSTHRWHYHYLLKGGTGADIVNHLLTKPHESMMFQDRALKFISTGIVGGLIYTAVGLGMAALDGSSVWCFIGDAGADSGQLDSAARYVDNHALPVTFIIENNNRSCNTSVADRWKSPDIHQRRTYGCVEGYDYVATWPHVGIGKHISF